MAHLRRRGVGGGAGRHRAASMAASPAGSATRVPVAGASLGCVVSQQSAPCPTSPGHVTLFHRESHGSQISAHAAGTAASPTGGPGPPAMAEMVPLQTETL